MHRTSVIVGIKKSLDVSASNPFKLIARWQGTNFGVHNPSARIREKRLRDPREIDLMTRSILRPCLPECIIPPYALPEKECPPWPYKQKGYHWYHRFLENTTKRFDENTRIITVEGNIGSGCSEFAKDLAKRLDFYHIRQPKIEDILIDRYGIDKRNYYHLLPEKFCLFDTEMFFTAPDHPMVISRALHLFQLKVEAYCNALAHVLNTGQGVVVERSAFTDNAFVRAMYEKGFVDDIYADFYKQFRVDILSEFKLLPHLVIYLDSPVSTCMENVKKRGRPWEINGKVIDYDYLACLEDEFKQYLKRAEKDSAILILDWKTPADMDSVLDEVYRVDLAYDYNESDRFEYWNLLAPEWEWNEARYKFTDKRSIIGVFDCVFVKIPQMVLFPDEVEHFIYVIERIGLKFSAGYNRRLGDKVKDIIFNKNSDCIVNSNWEEYISKDGLWSSSFENFIYMNVRPYMPDIPDEDFEPRRFDPQCLTHWKDH